MTDIQIQINGVTYPAKDTTPGEQAQLDIGKTISQSYSIPNNLLHTSTIKMGDDCNDKCINSTDQGSTCCMNLVSEITSASLSANLQSITINYKNVVGSTDKGNVNIFQPIWCVCIITACGKKLLYSPDKWDNFIIDDTKSKVTLDLGNLFDDYSPLMIRVFDNSSVFVTGLPDEIIDILGTKRDIKFMNNTKYYMSSANKQETDPSKQGKSATYYINQVDSSGKQIDKNANIQINITPQSNILNFAGFKPTGEKSWPVIANIVNTRTNYVPTSDQVSQSNLCAHVMEGALFKAKGKDYKNNFILSAWTEPNVHIDIDISDIESVRNKYPNLSILHASWGGNIPKSEPDKSITLEITNTKSKDFNNKDADLFDPLISYFQVYKNGNTFTLYSASGQNSDPAGKRYPNTALVDPISKKVDLVYTSVGSAAAGIGKIYSLVACNIRYIRVKYKFFNDVESDMLFMISTQNPPAPDTNNVIKYESYNWGVLFLVIFRHDSTLKDGNGYWEFIKNEYADGSDNGKWVDSSGKAVIPAYKKVVLETSKNTYDSVSPANNVIVDTKSTADKYTTYNNVEWPTLKITQCGLWDEAVLDN